tara:strand:- start:79 stop:510 length:432 start_codon:yes stop_codon:yes gene_type:complete
MRFFLILTLIIFFNIRYANGNEPFVVLEYKGKFGEQINGKIDKNNKFIKDQNYSVIHKVKPGESLSGILKKYYGNSGFNMRIIEVSLIEINKHAFVRNNPNYLFAGKKIKIPSINEIMNLVKNKPNMKSQSSGRRSHIYFYGN